MELLNENNWYFYYNIEIQENCISNFAEATAVFMLPSSIVDESFNISVFPNPTPGAIFVSAKDRIKEIHLYDISGRLCLTQSASDPLVEIDCSLLSKGMYIIKIITEKHIFLKNPTFFIGIYINMMHLLH